MKRLKTAEKAIRKANKLEKKTGIRHRVVQEDDGFYVVDEETYQATFRELCADPDILMNLVHTIGSEFKVAYDTLEEAKLSADRRAVLYGGVWHVIFNEDLGQFVDVWEAYIKKHKVKSLYKSEDNKDVDINDFMKDLGMNRQQRRKITNKVKK